MSTVLLDSTAIKRVLGRMVHEILERNIGSQDLVVVGILRRGYPVGKRLAFMLSQAEDNPVPLGKVDIRPVRDDERRSTDDESEIPFELNGKHVVLVDEVMFTGRTVRAGIEALLKFGRPKSIQLAVLIDRKGHRELPIQPDYVGKVVETEPDERVTVMLREVDGDDVVVLVPLSERIGA